MSNVKEALDLGLFRPELTDPEMISQMLWAGVHGLSVIHVSAPEKSHPWMQLRDPIETASTMNDVLLRGLLRNPTF
jgi:hypothetical protein